MRFAVALFVLGGAVDLDKNGIGVLVTLRVWAICPRRIRRAATVCRRDLRRPTTYCMNVELRLVLFVSLLYGLAFREWTSAHAIS
jgi:hypothetical protein